MESVDARETLGFQAEITQLLNLMIQSLYSNKAIFLRELISNASDAIDRLRFAALSDDRLSEAATDFAIRITYDATAHTLTVADNGIGMTRDEVITHIGTIAYSGTKAFLESLTGDQQRDAHLIGQFGVGFYSAFIVADRVTVTTRHAGLLPEEGVRWESAGQGTYTIEPLVEAERGTRVTLHLREGEEEFLDGQRLRTLIRTYSDHISVPIRMPTDGEQGDEQVNRAAALWTRPKADITPQEYAEFYRSITHDFADPLLTLHRQMEGTLEYTLLLFIPTEAPFDLWQHDQRHGVKLYVRRVFIMDDTEQLLPRYLRFVRGIIDSPDLPLNVSREILQQHRVIEQIRTGAVKRLIGALGDLARDEPERYATFWSTFGRVLKEGMVEDTGNHDALVPLFRFAATNSTTVTQDVALEQYRARMKPGQTHIYYLIAENATAATESPLLEIFRQKDVEVLLLTDPIDAVIESAIREYQGVPLHSVARGQVDLSAIADIPDVTQKPEDPPAAAPSEVLKRLHAALGEVVKEVRASARLTTSPACLINDDQALDPALARLLKANGQVVPAIRPILEVNLAHAIVQRMADEPDTTRFADWAFLLYEQSLLSRGDILEHPARFVARMNALLAGEAS